MIFRKSYRDADYGECEFAVGKVMIPQAVSMNACRENQASAPSPISTQAVTRSLAAHSGYRLKNSGRSNPAREIASM
jgi:hypothetical protein